MNQKLQVIKEAFLVSLDKHFKLAFAVVAVSLIAWELSLIAWVFGIWLLIVGIRALDELDRKAVDSQPEA